MGTPIVPVLDSKLLKAGFEDCHLRLDVLQFCLLYMLSEGFVLVLCMHKTCTRAGSLI